MEPRVIKKLDEVVINRIAAGEVVQRPANALKELLENSIDAKSTNITITVKSGGLKYLQIQDNGTGIRKEDLEIVCERFTTSKLQKFEDLSAIATYGFRGEALASISHISHLTILTKTINEKCAYRASYSDGKLKDKPKPCAGNQGTQITVEDLFYNMQTRASALKNAYDEYQRVYEVVSKYAIHNPKIGFSLKKFGERNDLKTAVNSTQIDNIRSIYGNDIAKELIEVQFHDESLKLKVFGLVTNANFSTKKPASLLFINHRLVDSVLLRKAIDGVYNSYLPKGSHPFLYISLEIDPRNCDVNIHPTKHEVHFLHEEEIIDVIKSEIEKKLLGSNVSRTLYVQTRLPGAGDITNDTIKDSQIHDKNLVRTDFKEQKLEKFFGEINQSQSTKRMKTVAISHRNKNRVNVRLKSVLELRDQIISNSDSNLRDLFSQHKFVGIISDSQSLIQYSTKLFLCDTHKISEELFYQFILYDFQNFDEITFETPLSIYELVVMALEFPDIEYNPDEDGSKEDIAKTVKEILIDKAAMLNTYFALRIDPEGNLLSIPMLLKQYLPDLSNLPIYLLRLATEVNWESEKECFDSFAKQTAVFYSTISTDDALQIVENDCGWKWVVEHVLYPALKQYYIPDKELKVNGSLMQIANLPNLYKVFERC